MTRREPVRLVDLADLAGRNEIAERAGVRLATVDTWRRRYPDFPAPMGTISGTPIWFWPDVEAWVEGSSREVGRPARETRMTPTAPLPARLARAIRKPDPEDDDGHTSNTA